MNKEMYKSGEYLEKNPTWHVEDSAWKANQIIRIMKRNNIVPNSICEVGCGAKDRLVFHLKDVLKDEKAFFDVIMAIDVIEHIEDYYGFLRNLRQKGQYKIFQIPLDLSVQSVLRCSPILLQREKVGHINYFTKETALSALIDSDYKILDYFYAYGLIDLPPRNLNSLLTRLPIKIMYYINKDMTVRIFGNSSLIVLAK